MKTKLNILPIPTFSHLGVNFIIRELDESAADSITLSSGSADITRNTECTIKAANGEQKSVIQYVSGDSSVLLNTSVKAEKSAHVTLLQVFDSKAEIISSLNADIAENAKLELVQLYIGGDTVSEIKTNLSGRCAEFASDIAYKLDNNNKLDINLIADHYGRKTVSKIAVGGVMSGDSDKVFKGTIDFKNGAVGAKGTENEDVLLIGENVRCRTVPVILCAEEDVEGSHGATAGRIDDEKLFYMRSRGLSDERIMQLIARAKISRVTEMIDDKMIKQRVYASLGWGDIDE